MKTLSATLKEEQIEHVDQLVDAHGISRSAFLRWLIDTLPPVPVPLKLGQLWELQKEGQNGQVVAYIQFRPRKVMLDAETTITGSERKQLYMAHQLIKANGWGAAYGVLTDSGWSVTFRDGDDWKNDTE